jgi:hypothetical protein
MTNNFNFEKDLEVNENALDEEWIKQPYLYMSYAEAAAHAIQKAKEIKEKVNIIKAEADNRIRKDYEEKALKITETRINTYIPLDEEVQKINSELRKAELEVDLLNAGCKAMDHKKKALERLVDLNLSGYFSAPKEKIEYKNNNESGFKEKINKKRTTKARVKLQKYNKNN